MRNASHFYKLGSWLCFCGASLLYGCGGTGLSDAARKQLFAQSANSNPFIPKISLKGDNPMTLEVGTQYQDPGATALSSKDGDLSSAILVRASVNGSAIGTYSVLYQVTDSEGRMGTAARIVNVVDSSKPVISLRGAATIQLNVGDVFSDPGATASDANDGDLTSKIVALGTVNTVAAGVYQITYTVIDPAGNAATPVVRTITVVAPPPGPMIPPRITSPSEGTSIRPANEPFVISGNCQVGQTIYVMGDVSGNPFAPCLSIGGNSQTGAFTVQISLTGGDGLKTVTVVEGTGVNVLTDTKHYNLVSTSPTITVDPPMMTINLCSADTSYLLYHISAVDGLGRTIAVTPSGRANPFLAGSYTVTYTASDSAGNSVTARRTVNVSGQFGTENFGIGLNTVSDFDQLFANPSGHFLVCQSIDFANASRLPIGYFDVLHGNPNYVFTGVLSGSNPDGANFTLSNIQITNQSANPFTGLPNIGGNAVGFIATSSGVIENLNFRNLQVSGSSSSSPSMTGGVVGRALSNSMIQSVDIVGGQVQGGDNTGGLVGMNSGTIQTSLVQDVAVQGQGQTGGAVGKNGASITQVASFTTTSSSTASITGTQSVGGVVGQNSSSGTISRSYSTESVSGSSQVGGLAGSNQGALTDCYSQSSLPSNSQNNIGGLVGRNSGTVTNSYALGLGGLSYSQDEVGGLIGQGFTVSNHHSDVLNGQVTNSFWDKDRSGISQPDSSQASLYGSGISDEDLLDSSEFSSESGWDFNSVWVYLNGRSDQPYPVLRWHTP